MKDDNKTKKHLLCEMTELRSQINALEKSITGNVSAKLTAEDAYRYAESIVETIREPLLILDANLKIISANRNFYSIFKATPGETIGSFIYDLGNKQWDIPKLRELLEEVLPEKIAFDNFEVAHNFRDIGHKIMLLNARQIYRKDIGTQMILLAIEDITERKRLEDLLTDAEGRYRHVFETASDGIVLFEKREGKITHANQAAEKMLGYSLEETVGKNLQDIGIVDIDDFQTIMRILNEIGITHYTDIAIKTKSGQQIDTDIYLADRAKLVQCNIRDISERKRAEKKLQQTLETLRNAVKTTIQVIVSTVESRDPYTAVHQVRSANLARAIATEMDLSQTRIEGIRIAGSIHDLGKLSIPAEILSKPTRLTELELSLIKEHSRKGYDILKNVESAWPLSEIVYQHHERMDGSGYPRHLKGDEILMEARILAVADVVEAMASHRPYRPALGIDAALKEIGDYRGILYDADVVDTCLRLFREKGFQLEAA
jgi:PAS domain S-box-containing protein